MEIILNGISTKLEQETNLLTLVQDLDLDLDKIAVEVDMEVIPKSTYEQKKLNGGEIIEIIEFVGGG